MTVGDCRKEGDWAAAGRAIAAFPSLLKKRLQMATRQNCVELVGAVKRGIQSGHPEGGEPFAPLAGLTVIGRFEGRERKSAQALARKAFKMWNEGGKQAFKPLIDHGDLLGSITHALSSDELSGRVGVNRFAETTSTKDLVNIAKILHDGAVIQVTPRMRAYFFARWGIRKSNAPIIIPPRPFLIPVFLAYLPKMIGRYRGAMQNVIPAALPVWKPPTDGSGR